MTLLEICVVVVQAILVVWGTVISLEQDRIAQQLLRIHVAMLGHRSYAASHVGESEQTKK